MATLTIILLGILNLAAKAKGECCPLRVISGMGDLDDVYSLKAEVADKPEEICVDGCVYTRANASNSGEEYCFKNEQSSGSLECQILHTQIKLNTNSNKTIQLLLLY